MGETMGSQDADALRARIAELEADVARLRAPAVANSTTPGWPALVDGNAVGQSLERALDASELVGTWDWDIIGDRLTSDARFAALFSVDPNRAAAGLPITEYVDAIHPDDRPRVRDAIEAAIAQGGNYGVEYRVMRPDGSVRWVSARGRCFHDAARQPVRFPGVVVDITRLKAVEAKMAGQKRVLEMVATGALLHETLFALISFIESQESGSRCSLLVVAEDGAHLRCACGPSFSENYHAALNGVPIGPPYIGTCGEVVDQCTAVSVPDVAADTRFTQEWRDLLLADGLRAVRSTPVCDSAGRVIASFAIYYDRPRNPEPSDPELIKIATDLAAIILEHDGVERALQEATRQARMALSELEAVYHVMPAGMAVLDGELRYVRVNEALAGMNGVPVADHIGRRVREVVPAVADAVEEYFRRVFETGKKAEPLEFEAPTQAEGGKPRVWLENAIPLQVREGAPRLVLVTTIDITERKRVEEGLAASEGRLRAAIEGSPFPVMLHAEDGEVLALSRSWTDYSGYTADELPTHHAWLRLAYPGANERAIAVLEQEFAAERVVNAGEFTIHAKSGERRVWDLQAVPLGRLGDGRRLQLSAAVDVTSRKRAEDALAADVAALQQLQAVSTALMREDRVEPVLDNILDAAQSLMRTDCASIQMLDAVGRDLLLIGSRGFHPASAAFWARVDASSASSCGAALARNERIVVEDVEACAFMAGTGDLDAYRKSGIRAVQSTPLVSRAGRPLGMISTHWRHVHAPDERDLRLLDVLARQAADVIERAKASAALRESEERLRTLADNIPLLCWIAEPDGHIGWYNRRWYEYTGTTPEQMQGWGWQSVHDPAELPGIVEAWKRSLASGEHFEIVFPMKGADGVFRPFLTRAVPIRDDAARIVRWFGTNTEVKDMVEAREALARDRVELERLVEERTAALLREVEDTRRAEVALRQGEKLQAIGQLTGGIAHDFNNIVQVVASGATLLRSPRLSEERRTLVLDGISKAAENARDLTTRLLAFARRQALQPEAFELNARLIEMSELLRHTLGSRIQVATDFDDSLWAVHADPGQLEVALLNLAVNARDAMPEGGTLTLQTRNATLGTTLDRRAGDYVCLAVRDTGKGMSPAVLARAFEPFFTTKGAGKGTGLGLAQVFGFAKQSGGDVAIESSPPEGTTVTVHLPRATRAQMDVALSTQAEAPGVALERTAGRTVLVVDDNRDVARFTAGMLESLGYISRIAFDGEEALALLDGGETVDAVFSDVMMPGDVDGVRLAGILRQRHPQVAVLLATGYSEVLTEGQGAATAEVLRKPYRLDDVAAALDRALAAVATPNRDVSQDRATQRP